MRKMVLAGLVACAAVLALFAASRADAGAEPRPAACVCSDPVGPVTMQVASGMTEPSVLKLMHCRCGALDCAWEPGFGIACK